jgi:hypothetical protein
MFTRTLITTLLAAACAAAVPAGASAAPQYRSAAFDVHLNGEQVSTWEYHEDTLKDDPCGSKIDSYGDQTIAFGSGGTGRLLIAKPPAGKPLLVLTNAEQQGAPWPVAALATRDGTYNVDIGTNRDSCDNNGGGVDPKPYVKDCGRRSGQLVPRIEGRSGGRARLFGVTQSWGGEDHDALGAPLTGLMLDEVTRTARSGRAGPAGTSTRPSSSR